MYYVKTRVTRELARETSRARGRTGSRRESAVVGIGSLVTAQRVAKLLRGNGLLR